jgi:transcriptional regulator with XRE-family HTH domain
MPRHNGTDREYLDHGIPALCRRLEAAREKKDWTKRDLARAAGVAESQVAKLLDPQRFGEPQLGTMVKIARALGLTLDGLFGLPPRAEKIPPGEDPIAYILVHRECNLAQLGTDAGLSHGTLPAIVAGKSRPDLFTALAIARAGGVSVDSLAAGLRARA